MAGYRERRERTGSGRAGVAGGGGEDYYYGPEILQHDYLMQSLGLSREQGRELLEYQARRDDADRAANVQMAEMKVQSAENAARIAADGYAQAAATGAEADIYAADQALRAAQERAAAARYAADQALEGIRVQETNRLKIAAAELKLKAQQVASEELGAPSDWRKQAGFLRGMGMTQESIAPSAIQQTGEMLGPVDPGMYQAAAQPPPQAAPQAVVGEAGPELATATPQGVQVEPIQPETAWWLRKQGTEGMQWGGTIRRSSSFIPSTWGGGGGYTAGMGPSGSFTIPPITLPPTSPSTPSKPPVYGQPTAPALAAATPAPAPVPAPAPAPTPEPTPIPGEGTTAGEPPYLEMLRSGAYVPLWQAWGGPRTKPEVGMDIPIKMPHEINYGNFLRLTPTEQQMAFADWEALGMPPDTAFRIMQASAMRGTARAATAYG